MKPGRVIDPLATAIRAQGQAWQRASKPLSVRKCRYAASARQQMRRGAAASIVSSF